MREHPWAQTPMGDPGTWSAGLRTAVRICLTSRFPMIVWWGPELRFLYNDAYMPLLGTNHPATAKPGEQVWSEIWHIIGPMLESVMNSGEATWSEDLLLPLSRHGYLEETYWTYSYSPLHDDDGAVRGVFTAVSDTTERVIGERQLAALQDLGAQAGLARDAAEAGRLVARSLGRAAMDVPFAAVYLRRDGGDDLELVATSPADAHPADLPDWPLQEVLAEARPVTVTDLADRAPRLPSGGWQAPPTQAVLLPLAGETGGRPIGVIALAASAGRALDAAYHSFLALVARQSAALVNAARAYQNQQRRAEELAELDRAKTTFFSNISHEFRTPLTLIAGPLEELRSRPDGTGAGGSEQLEVIHRNALRLGKLVNTLLDFSRIEAGRMQARYEPVDLAAVTAELAGVFRSAVDQAGLVFEVDCRPLPEPVRLDRAMWEKVVLNLLSNALKFTFTGSIRVSVRAEGQEAVVRVTDTGIGVAAEEMPRLFERFHRIESARSRSGEGSGIGLALVQELVALHGGSIGARSREGEGTEFTVRLPTGTAHLPAHSLAPAGEPRGVPAAAEPFVQEALRWLPQGDGDEASAALPSPVRAQATPYRTGGGPSAPVRVLIADDNADMRDYLTRLLTSAGYLVSSAADGLAALEAVRRDTPDLLVSDVMMPRLDGLQLVAALRGDPSTAAVPVLLLSARAGQEASIEGLDAGADDYLVKPFSAADLLARVRANVELARLRSHHASWRTALIDSLQEAFLVVDDQGAVVETNAAFTDILGYGPEGLPYPVPHPWWPDRARHPQAHRQAREAFTGLTDPAEGARVTPVTHRDGHRLWVAATFNRVQEQQGRELTVGTFRDVSAEHYALQRDTAVAALSVRLAEAAGVDHAIRGALEQFRALWQARQVLAVTFPEAGEPTVAAAGAGGAAPRWDTLPAEHRARLETLRRGPLLTAISEPGGTAGITVEHPGGLLALRIELGENRPFGAEDRTLLTLLAGRLGQGLHRTHQIDQHRETALTLQRAILGPSRLPDGFAVRYEPAGRPLEVGGDWYDTVALPDGRLGIVVGDCVGRGLQAATVMGQLRSACRALLLQEAGPARTLMALDRFAALIPAAMCTTVFCGVLDPADGRLTYASAGHPPGILALPDGSIRLLDGGRSVPLAVRPGHHRPEAGCTVPARATLMLYTDGLVERRRRPLTEGIVQAGGVLDEGRELTVDGLATSVMARLAPRDGYEDDVALLVYRHPAPLDLTFPADSAQLAPVRGALRDWLGRCELDHPVAQNVLVAAGEACANAIEHGHRDAPGRAVRLRAAATAEHLRLSVTDSGSWKPPQPGRDPGRGRGLILMRALMQQVTVEPGAAGTTVEMHTRIAR
ncbi:SpoIIE family protein phosphatase [Kitasatospora sp. NPDC049258]|uniref:SpoIIE family protein phosphatase n=1 Tax=Kitasatospora sp. NPDC049258 TaxID=3155394 RepID=UPI003442EDDE